MYLLRLDDASQHWNKDNWVRMHELCLKYGIIPIVAIIPHNEDEKILQFPEDPAYLDRITSWIKEDSWTPALHGYCHVFISNKAGINPINNRSEFAGVDIETQKRKIRNGIRILGEIGIHPEIFVAPAHTFDENTLIALCTETSIRIISDTIARDIYYKAPFFFIPQQSGSVRSINFPIVTFCYHPNYMDDNSFQTLEGFIKKHKSKFTSFDKLAMKERKLGVSDRLMRTLYFAKRKLNI